MPHGDLRLSRQQFLGRPTLDPKLADRSSKSGLWLGGTTHFCTLSNAGGIIHLK
jgi:hypothetical protein